MNINKHYPEIGL